MSGAKQVAQSLRLAKSIVLILHQNPDGDAIGSSFAIKSVLTDKVATIVCSTKIPDLFSKFTDTIDITNQLPRNAELYVVLDCPDLKRTGFAEELKAIVRKKKLIVIDHHQQGDLSQLANEYLLDRTASSCCEIMMSVIDELRCTITKNVATLLLLGIITDTGGFQHPNTTVKTLNVSAKLIRFGANSELIQSQISPKRDLSKLRFWGKVLAGVEINSMGIVVARVSKDQLSESSATEADLSGLAKYLCSVEGTKAALVLVETDAGWRGSLRTRSRTFNVGRLAKILGGKGGKKVAGFLATDDWISGTINPDQVE